MKIAIISDTHDNLANIKKTIDWLKKEKIEIIIHCGDVSNLTTLKEGFADFSGKIYLTLGNADLRDKKLYELSPSFSVFGDFGEITIDNKKIAFTHYLETAKNLSKTRKYDFVFYGHNHKPWLEKTGIFPRRPKLGERGECWLVNPGNIAGTFYKATFAVYNSEKDKLELKILEKLE